MKIIQMIKEAFPFMKKIQRTGWFGRPGHIGGKTHAVSGIRPICGTPIHKKAVFRQVSSGYNMHLLECSKCLKMLTGLKNERT